VKLLVEDIPNLDAKGELVALSNEEVELRKVKFKEMWRLLKCREASVFQRSKSKWLKEGDENSKHFHRCVKARAARNSLKAIKVDGEWVETPMEVRRTVVNFFQSHVVKESDGNKSSGPDGFNFAFFKEFWYLLKHEVRIMFDQFYANEKLPTSFLSYFVTLIPKVNNPSSLKEYRLISLLGCLYKILSKVLAARLSKVMNSIISASQSTFLKGRHLVDGVLVVNEVVDLARRSKRECLILKMDFEKAYDSVDWSFLEYILRRVGMTDKWVRWMKACMFGGSMSILVNGIPTKELMFKEA